MYAEAMRKMSSYYMSKLASRTEAVSPAVHIDVDATPAPASLGIILFGNLDK